MRIKVKRQQTVEVEVDVEFPVYHQSSDIFDSGGSYEALTRIDANGVLFKITRRQGGCYGTEYEFERGKINLEHGLAQYVEQRGHDGGPSDAKAFASLVDEARAVLASFQT